MNGPTDPARRKIEANVGGAFTYDDRLGIREDPPVDVDDEVAAGKTRERAVDASRKLIVRRPRAERFANGEPEKIPDAQRSCEREGARAAG